MSNEFLVGTVAALVGFVGLVMLFLGAARLITPRSSRLFSERRRQMVAAWQQIFYGVVVLLIAAAVLFMGPPAVALVNPPTPTPLFSPTPSVTPGPSPTPTLTPTVTQTLPPTDTPPPTTPAPTGPPTLPVDLITPPAGTLTVTPPANGVIANLRLSTILDCASTRGDSDFFDTQPRTIYALFDYNNWARDAQWTYVWRRGDEIVYVFSGLWDGSTGGCGFAEYDGGAADWPPGAYQVQIFLGQTLMDVANFTVSDSTPTPTPTP